MPARWYGKILGLYNKSAQNTNFALLEIFLRKNQYMGVGD
jgi:hypothetical protein